MAENCNYDETSGMCRSCEYDIVQYTGKLSAFLKQAEIERLVFGAKHVQAFSQFVTGESKMKKRKSSDRISSRAKMWENVSVMICVCVGVILSSAIGCKGVNSGRLTSSDVTAMTARAGETLILPCGGGANNLTLDPFTLATWSRDGVTIDQTWRRFKQQRSKLRIRGVKPVDTGLYQCEAVTGFGTRRTRIDLIVVQEDNHAMTSSSHRRNPRERKPVFSNPVKMRQQNIVKPSETTVRLRCRASGRPRPDIQWYKDGKLVRTGYDLTTHKPHWTLTLHHVRPEDSGKYLCRVRNRLGEIRYEYTLRVIGHKLERPVLIKDHPLNQTAQEGTMTSLMCMVRSDRDPPTVKWIKEIDPHMLRNHDRENWLEIEDKYYVILPPQEMMMMADGSYLNKYTIDSAIQARDTGMYICLAANTMGYSYRYAYLTVTPRTNGRADTSSMKISSSSKSKSPNSLLISIGIPACLGGVVVCALTVYCLCKRDRVTSLTDVITERLPHRRTTHVTVQSTTSSSTSRDADDVIAGRAINERQNVLVGASETSELDDVVGDDMTSYGGGGYPFAPPLLRAADKRLWSISDVSEFPPPPPPSPPSRYSRHSSSTDVTSSRRHHHHHHHHHRCPATAHRVHVTSQLPVKT